MFRLCTGHGDLDVLLIKDLLLQLKKYNAVECDEDLCETLKNKISGIDGRNIQVENVYNH